jgi:hypothetical protein
VGRCSAARYTRAARFGDLALAPSLPLAPAMKSAAVAFAVIATFAGCSIEEDEDDGLVELDSELALQQFHGRFGSPSIVRDGDDLHAYFAIQAFEGETVHVAHARSDDGGAHWLRIGDALPRLNEQAVQSGSVWAPAATRIDDDHWMLYYTAVEKGTERHMCTYRAHAKGPRGPFIDDYAGPIVCPNSSLWAIDPYVVKDAHGDRHLLMRIDEPNGVNTIAIRKLAEFGQHFAPGSEWDTLTRITKAGWEEPVMENAAMVRLPDPSGNKRWYVFYSGGSYRNNTYAVGYADCGTSIHGPCVKKTVDEPWLTSRPELQMFGPGTPTFYRLNGEVLMAVNTWKFSGGQDNPQNHGQIMHIFKVRINANGKPVATFVRMVE